MIEPISTGLAVGAGWFANKLFGPSADALGEALKSYGTSRLQKIFNRAAEKADPTEVEALPPGFVVTFFQKASFSEDDDSLTEMWANLLAQAATNFTNRHAAYVEILSELTAFDAMTIAELVPEDTPYFPQISAPVNLKVELRLKLAQEMKNISDTQEEAQAEFERLMNFKFDWPGRITAARIHYRDGDITRPITGGIPDQFASFDNLSRLGLVEKFDLNNSMKPYETAIEGVLVTMLGIGFVQTCRGRLLKPAAGAEASK
jgi:hypothetical protein